MKIIAKKGEAYLVQITDELGRIYDPTLHRIYAPFSLKEIFETGGWEPVGDDIPDIEMLISNGMIEEIGIQKRATLPLGNQVERVGFPAIQ